LSFFFRWREREKDEKSMAFIQIPWHTTTTELRAPIIVVVIAIFRKE